MWNLPGPGVKTMSPALAVGFLTIRLPRKSLCAYLPSVHPLWKNVYSSSLPLLNWIFFKVEYDYKEIQPVHSKGDQSWVFIGRTDAKAETPVLWPPDAKSWLIGKDSDAGRDWGQEEKGTAEDEMAGWHHWLDAHEFGWTLRVGDGQGGLVCCSSWGRKELDMTERLIWNELNWWVLCILWISMPCQTYHLQIFSTIQ